MFLTQPWESQLQICGSRSGLLITDADIKTAFKTVETNAMAVPDEPLLEGDEL
jgi:hypothetical protein